MLAVGPLAILPSPVLAAVPTTTPFTVVNGSVTWTGAGNLGTVNATTDRAIVSWMPGQFNVLAGDIFSFQVPAGGGILNKVGYGTTGSNTSVADNAIINGTVQSNGRVFLLANGNILIGGGASVSTSGGLFLSTLLETDNFNFSALGNLAYTGTSAGSITIGNSATQANFVGNVGAWGGTISIDNISVSGDMIVNQRTAAAALNLTGPNGPTLIPAGNLTVVTSNGAVGQAAGALTVGNTTNINAGTAAVNLSSTTNNFGTILANATQLIVGDANGIAIGNSTIGGSGLTVNAGGNIATSGTVITATGGAVTLNATGGAVVFGNNSSVGGTFAANATGGNVGVSTIGNLTLGNVTATGNTASVTTTGTLTIGGTASAGTASLIGSAITSTSSGNVSTTVAAATLNATAGGIILPNMTVTRVVATANGGSISQNANTTITTSSGTTSTFNAGTAGAITLTNTNNLTNATLELTGTSAAVTTNSAVTIGTTNLTQNLTVNTATANSVAGAGNVTLGAGFGTAAQDITIGGTLSVNTNNSAVIEDAASTNVVLGNVNITTHNGTFGALVTGAITLNGSQFAGSGYTANPSVTISGGGGSGATATAVQTGGVVTSVTITGAGSGYTSSPTITFSAPPAGGASANSALALSTLVSNGGSATFTAASAGVTGGGRYGQFNITSGNVNLHENTSLNLGTINAVAVLANSTAGDVLINGGVTSGTFTANANTGAVIQGPSSVLNISSTSSFRSSNSFGSNLVSTSNSFGGSVTIINGGTNIITSGGSITFTPANVTGGSLTVNVTNAGATANLANGNASDVRINGNGQVIMHNALVRNLTINTTDTSTNSIRQSQNLTANGTVTLKTSGGILLTHANNNLTGTVILSNVAGDSDIRSDRSFTVSGTSAGNLIATAGNSGSNGFSNPWNLTLGNLNVRNLTARAMNGNSTIGAAGNATAGNSGNINQASGTRLHVENVADFSTYNGNIIVANNGNNFGRVQASTGGATGIVGAGNIQLTEDAGLRVGNIASNGTVQLTSRFGSILEDGNALTTIVANGTTGISLSAANGSVQLGNVSGNTVGSNITGANATASGSVQLFSIGDLVLGTIAANSLTVTGNTVSQSAALNIFGLSSFTAANGINLTNSANNFGPVALNVTNANMPIAVSEGGTLNLRSVSMSPTGGNGTFTANSVNGDIVDTGLGGVKLGGAVAGSPAVPVIGSGVVTLTALNGNVLIDDPTSDVLTTGGVAFNANNVMLSVLGSPGATLVLGANNTASVATGNLTASSALGNIGNAGRFTVGGTAFFQTGNGNITIDQPNVGFGALRFVGNQVRITEGGNMDILTGSSAFGPAQLISGGSVNIIAGDGTVTFGNTVAFQATGDITLRQMQAVGTVSLSHTGTANLSLLSKSTDLNSRDPIDLGTGPYVGPRD
jgi:hypothetical protein